MDNNDLATSLLTGAQNIDKMKKDICDLMIILSGFIRQVIEINPSLDLNVNILSQKFQEKKVTWIVTYEPKRDRFHFECWLPVAAGLKSTTLAYCNTGGITLKPAHVSKVHSTLSDLAAAIASKYPAIKAIFQPFVDAAWSCRK